MKIFDIKIHVGDCLETLRALPANSVNCAVTSPPYFGLRDYGMDGQIGLEETPDQFVARLVEVFREVRRVLTDDGTLWLNIGDSYASPGGKQSAQRGLATAGANSPAAMVRCLEERAQSYAARKSTIAGAVKHKDLIGIPWMLAFALRADGWYLRQDIIWHKPNPMPESVRDRCTKAHEYVFLLSKGPRYFYDNEAMKEPLAKSNAQRTTKHYNTKGRYGAGNGGNGGLDGLAARMRSGDVTTRNRRSVWTVTTKPYKGAHFATYPPDLIEPCIAAGCPPGGVVLDPFGGAGTTGLVAGRLGRKALLCELNPEYAALAHDRIAADPQVAEVYLFS
jgi:site-specific DNA-methyltransferase (adenine-specific)